MFTNNRLFLTEKLTFYITIYRVVSSGLFKCYSDIFLQVNRYCPTTYGNKDFTTSTITKKSQSDYRT